MRAATQLVLVLMGGGALTAGTAMSVQSHHACQDARSHADPQAERICHSWTTGWHGGGYGHALGTAATSASGVSRGGFGLMGLHFGGFHG
jgi:hypothetical protein